MSEEQGNGARARLASALGREDVKEAAQTLREALPKMGLRELLGLGRALSLGLSKEEEAAGLQAELEGYADDGVTVPEVRKVVGFASAFPVRALDQNMLMPEEIFLSNREKFSQVILTIGQPIAELQTALTQIREGGVLSLKVPAAQISGESADTDEETMVYIYILPREIQRIVDAARARALEAVIGCLIDAALDPAAA